MQGVALGLRSFYRTQDHLVNKAGWDKAAHRGNRLFADWKVRWGALVEQLRPWVLNGTITGFHLGDELTWGGLPYADLVAMSDTVAATKWAAAEAGATATPAAAAASPLQQPTLYYNEAAGPSKPSSLVRFLPVSQHLLELAAGVCMLGCGVSTSRGA